MRSRKFAEVLKATRELYGLTLRQLAKRTGISNPMLSQYESGSMPSLKNAARIAEVLKFELSGRWR
jgi:transcriptional regulator with XRE-family HTH domain